MSCSILYRCPACGYEAEVSGRRDWGVFHVTETIVCRDCRELFDVRANEKPQDVEIKNGRIIGELTGIRCPKDPDHQIRPWRGPGACPRCGTRMVDTGICTFGD